MESQAVPENIYLTEQDKVITDDNKIAKNFKYSAGFRTYDTDVLIHHNQKRKTLLLMQYQISKSF